MKYSWQNIGYEQKCDYFAEDKLQKPFDFLTKNWSSKVKLDFVKKLDRNIEIIKNQPEIFP